MCRVQARRDPVLAHDVRFGPDVPEGQIYCTTCEEYLSPEDWARGCPGPPADVHRPDAHCACRDCEADFLRSNSDRTDARAKDHSHEEDARHG